MKTYAATAVGFVPVEERDVERFTLGARPPMDPEKSEHRLAKALAQGRRDPAPGEPRPGRRTGRRCRRQAGIFGRRR